jgi:hypothetical protein
MAEPFGSDDIAEIAGSSRKMQKERLTKLERVKLFAELLVKTIGHDDYLAIVTFGTTSRVVFSMRRMTDEAKVWIYLLCLYTIFIGIFLRTFRMRCKCVDWLRSGGCSATTNFVFKTVAICTGIRTHAGLWIRL